MHYRRSTSSLTLVLIGTAALSGCQEETARRDVYRSPTDCKQDWGSEPGKCEPVQSGPHTGYYYGPAYRGGTHTAAGVQPPRAGSNAVATANVPRGGFGSTSSAHSSGS